MLDDSRLYMAQRLTALLMAPLVLGTSGGDDLCHSGRIDCRRNPWPHARLVQLVCCSTALFVLAVSIHGAIGLRTHREWSGEV